ncbi:DNA mismatch repair protein MutS, partial [Tamlana crocina]|nr:DNA mismatch repair protein MutS [Tamlana crocina]
EQEIFSKLVEWIGDYIQPVQQNAILIGQVDCLCSFAHHAVSNNYCKPEIDDSFELEIKNGRHPVIEKQLPLSETYVANDVYLDRESQQIIMIT